MGGASLASTAAATSAAVGGGGFGAAVAGTAASKAAATVAAAAIVAAGAVEVKHASHPIPVHRPAVAAVVQAAPVAKAPPISKPQPVTAGKERAKPVAPKVDEKKDPTATTDAPAATETAAVPGGDQVPSVLAPTTEEGSGTATLPGNSTTSNGGTSAPDQQYGQPATPPSTPPGEPAGSGPAPQPAPAAGEPSSGSSGSSQAPPPSSSSPPPGG
jgi:hypothetical protein